MSNINCNRLLVSWKENLQGVAGFPVVDAAAKVEMEEEKEKSKFDQQPVGHSCHLFWHSRGFEARLGGGKLKQEITFPKRFFWWEKEEMWGRENLTDGVGGGRESKINHGSIQINLMTNYRKLNYERN